MKSKSTKVCLFITLTLFVQCFALSTLRANPKSSLSTVLSGVKYAMIELPAEQQRKVDTGDNQLLKHFAHYLRTYCGIEHIAIKTQEKERILAVTESYCDIVHVSVQLDLIANSYFTNHSLSFTTCLGDTYDFKKDRQIPYDNNALEAITNLWKECYSGASHYNERNRLRLPINSSPWSGPELKSYIETTSLTPIEGLYEKVPNPINQNRYSVGIVKNAQGGYSIIYLGGAKNHKDWRVGELMGHAQATATPNRFTASWLQANKALNKNVHLQLDPQGNLLVSFEGTVYKEEQEYIKLLPHNAPPVPAPDFGPLQSSGSSVVITEDGHLLTNYHVIEGSQRIRVGVDGIEYNAAVIGTDMKNDLAILQITDPTFTGFPQIPYQFLFNSAPVGQEVYTLGYPLAGSMGWEAKFTNGNISAHSGFGGDASTYHTSVPVEPGSSGGPLFDNKGNLVGIVKAKHSQANNATYVIKLRNVYQLLDNANIKLKNPAKTGIQSKALTDQIKSVKPFVFYVKVY